MFYQRTKLVLHVRQGVVQSVGRVRGERKANRAKRIKSASTDRTPLDLWSVLCPVCTRNVEDPLIIS